WRCPAGELDLVLRSGELVVFCEVKTRAGDAFGGGHEAVTWRKQRKLRQLAELFLSGLRVAPAAVRFDVASVLARPGTRPVVEVFEDAFWSVRPSSAARFRRSGPARGSMSVGGPSVRASGMVGW